MAKDKEAFDREMLERRAVEAREVEIAENMGYIMPTKEEREKIELRKSEEVLERVVPRGGRRGACTAGSAGSSWTGSTS